MGNAAGKRAEETPRVDGGFVFPTGTVYKSTDADLRVVKRLIIERKLSPFYVGSDAESPTCIIECPICFMYLPPNLNSTRCCGQLMCTECFLQIKHPPTGGSAVCPFCVQPEFGVIYPPSSIVRSERRRSLPHNAANVVTLDRVKPGSRKPAPMTAARGGEVSRRNTVASGGRNVPRRTQARAEPPPSSAPPTQPDWLTREAFNQRIVDEILVRHYYDFDSSRSTSITSSSSSSSSSSSDSDSSASPATTSDTAEASGQAIVALSIA